MRDMTKARFDKALAEHGIAREAMGYFNVGHGVAVYARNCRSESYRAWLAYLLAEQERVEAEARNARGTLNPREGACE